MRKVIINVTQEDINAGVPGNCHYCPVSLALRRATNNYWTVRSHLTYGIFENTRWVSVELPIAVQQFIRNFDSKLPVEPFSFEIWDF